MDRFGIKYGEKGLEYFKCEKCPKRNTNSKKKGQFKVRRYLANIELECLYCKTKYIIPMRSLCYNCDTLGEVVIFTKEEYVQEKKKGIKTIKI